jgi:hypothetical protein
VPGAPVFLRAFNNLCCGTEGAAARHCSAVDYLYSLYDALVSINVPSDKARAVVDAMERDMGTTLATKPDLEALKVATRHDLETMRLATKQDLELLKQAMDNRFALIEERFESLRGNVSRDLVALKQGIVIQLGSVVVACFGLTLAVMRFWMT